VQHKGETGRADIALTVINKLYSIERELKDFMNHALLVGPPAAMGRTLPVAPRAAGALLCLAGFNRSCARWQRRSRLMNSLYEPGCSPCSAHQMHLLV
jgi:hypothetical protein